MIIFFQWKAAIQERTPFYFYYTSYSPRKKFDVALDDYKMNEVAYLFLVPKESGEFLKLLDFLKSPNFIFR